MSRCAWDHGRMFALTFVAAAFPAGVFAQQTAPPGWADFTKAFDSATDHDRIVGASIVVLRDGRMAAHHEHWLADRAGGKRVNEDTIFHYGSITKTLTAIAIIQLRDRGRLSLDDHVTRYIPDLRQVHDAYGSMDDITIRMLLSHSAGFQNPTWPYKEGKPWEPFEPTTWNQLVAMMPYQELLFKPGSRYSYSNPAFIYLARIIEQLTGDAWETYVQKNIFAPLGLSRSYFGITPYYLEGDRSHNYTVVRDPGENETVTVKDNGAEFDPGITIPNGGWNAPLGDLGLYLAFLTNATHGDAALQRRYDTVLKRSSLEEMWRPLYPTTLAQNKDKDKDKDKDGAAEAPTKDHSESMHSESMALSFFVVRRGTATFIGHTGSQAGFRAFMYLNPANGKAVVAAFNSASDQESQPGQSAVDIIREAALKLIE